MKRLEGVKWQLEEGKRAKEQCVAELHGLEKVVEQRQVALVVSSPKAGLSRAPPQKPERSAKGVDLPLGIIIPEKNCTHCIMWGSLCCWDPDGCTWSC